MSRTGHIPTPLGPTRKARAALPIAVMSRGMTTRAVSVRPPDVVFVKGLLEASDGLASVFAERGGDLWISAPPGREAELDELIADLVEEVGLRIVPDPTRDDAAGGEPWDMRRQDP